MYFCTCCGNTFSDEQGIVVKQDNILYIDGNSIEIACPYCGSTDNQLQQLY